jgi:ATP-dependent Clp protease ATP-binding subunit ClpA
VNAISAVERVENSLRRLKEEFANFRNRLERAHSRAQQLLVSRVASDKEQDDEARANMEASDKAIEEYLRLREEFDGRLEKIQRVMEMVTSIGKQTAMTRKIDLNLNKRNPRAQEFEQQLSAKIVGQERALKSLGNLYQMFLAGMNAPHKPIGTMLFLGPTGSGKTRVVEAAAEALFGNPHAVIKIDCAEFQHSHEIAKLIGSPPGYLGHRETTPLLTQENLDRHHTLETEVTFVLFDEIEKASDSLWQLLLGILDKATLTLGDNRKVDFSKTVVIMTSNLGAREMSELITGGIGFARSQESQVTHDADVDKKIYRTAVEAARRKFSPEFMNRIDNVVVFRSLKEEHLRQILELELQGVQDRIMASSTRKFAFQISDEAKDMLLNEGIDYKYGARHLKRAVERFLVFPLSNLVATDQIDTGDIVHIELNHETNKLSFSKSAGESQFNDGDPVDDKDRVEQDADYEMGELVSSRAA